MRLAPMRFKGYEWRYNPAEISFECEKQISELKAPAGKAYIQNSGRKNLVISGSGSLMGEDCTRQFSELLSLFKQQGSGVLAIDGILSLTAVFESVKITGRPRPDVLEYSFVFREVMEESQTFVPTFHISKEDETLWDISYAYGVSIDKLVELNPFVKRPDELETGSRVVLC